MNNRCLYRVGIKGTTVDETGRFLLSRENNGKWEFLGGGLDHGEDPIACLRREIFEETGLQIIYVSPTPKYVITSRRLGHDTYIANIIYEIKLKDLNFVPSEECQELRYFTVDEARQVELFPNVKSFLGVYKPELHL